MDTRSLGCVTYLVPMIVQIGLEYSLCLDEKSTFGLNVCKSLELSLGLMLIEGYIRSLAIDIEDMGTHVFTPGMVDGITKPSPCHPVLCWYAILCLFLLTYESIWWSDSKPPKLVSSWVL